jgi:hypothetical protein
MNGMVSKPLLPGCSLIPVSSVAPMNNIDIRVLSRNAGGIDQLSARQWIEAALGRHLAQAPHVVNNFVWVLM